MQLIDRPLKIALIHSADSGGGAERCVLDLHLSLLELGHQSYLYVGRQQTDNENLSKIENVRTIPGLLRITYWLERNLGLQRLYSPGFRRLSSIIDSDTDVVHIHSLWGAENYADIGGVSKLARRFPTVMTLHEAWLLTGHCACPIECNRWKTGCGKCPDLGAIPSIKRDGTRFNWLRKYIALRSMDVTYTTVSEWLREMAMQSPLMSGREIEAVHNSIDNSVFVPGSKKDARAKLGVPDDRPVVLLTGQALKHPVKGINDAIQAIKQCPEDSLTVLLVGRASDVIKNNLSNRCVAIPYQSTLEDMALCYQAADLTLVPSYFESFGRVAAESQACGTAVLGYATGGLPEVVQSGTTGYLVPTGDVDALSQHLNRLVHQPDELRLLGENGTEWIRQLYGKEHITKKYLDIYQSAIKQRNNKA